MSNRIHDIVYQFSVQMKKLFGDNLSKIIMYGSYARGDYNQSSDIDIMVLVHLSEEDIKSKENMVYDIAFDLEMETGLHISPIIKSESQYDYWVEVLPFYKNIQKEGIVINE
jgi:predicted nucleotidyltransferase